MIISRAAAVVSAFILAVLCQCSAVFAAEPGVVTNTKTQAHKELFDIPILMTPAKGLNLAKSRSGCLDKAKKVVIEASEIRVSYEKLLQEFNGENLKKAGMSVKLRSDYIWNGTRTTLLKIFQKEEKTVVGKWVLLIDRGEKSWLVNGLYYSKDQKRSEMVLNMLKSAYWDEAPAEAMAESAPLGSINTDGLDMKLAGIRHGAFVYTRDGFLPTKHADGTFFVVYRHPNKSLITPEQRLSYAKTELANIEKDKSLDIISETAVQIDRLAGVELAAYTNEPQKSLLFVTLLFDGKDAIIMSAVAKENTIDNLEMFHKLSSTYSDSAAGALWKTEVRK